MGTVEKIVETMHRLCNDKKLQVTHRYDHHSTWLQGELKQIRDLLQNTVTEELPRMETSSEVNHNDASKKRKSPEVCVQGERGSPMPKRTSTDYAELCVAAGLPADLNKLKKDQLLEELAKRGNVSMTMKALKKDLVDALKALVLDIHLRNLKANEQQQAEENEVMEQDVVVESPKKMSVEAAELTPEELVTETNTENTEPTAPSRISLSCDVPPSTPVGGRTSLFSSLRSQLQSPAKPVETEAERSLRLEMEYKARINRHRTSQGAIEVVEKEKEVVVEEVVLDVPTMELASPAKHQMTVELKADDEICNDEPDSQPNEEKHDEENQLDDEQPQEQVQESSDSIAEEECPHECCDDMENPDENDANDANDDGNSTCTEELDENVDEVSVAQESVVNADDTWNEVPSPKNSPKAQKKSVAAEPKSASESPRPRLQSDDTTETKASTATNIKKPSNLVGGGQLSFLSNTTNNSTTAAAPPAKQKTVVPALILAQKQKEREEQKLLQKKRDLEEKKRKIMEQKNGTVATSSAIPGSKSIASNKPVTSASIAMNNGASRVPVAASGATAGKPAPVPATKKNMFGWVKPNTTIESTAVPEKPNDENANPASSIPPPPSQAPDMSHALQEKVVSKPEAAAQFPIDDSEGSDSETDDDESAAEKKENLKKMIPDWARGQQLREALERQFGMKGEPPVDPDALFGDVRPCILEEIFGKSGGKCGKYSARTSSAKWDADQITLVEKRKYKMAMGYM